MIVFVFDRVENIVSPCFFFFFNAPALIDRGYKVFLSLLVCFSICQQ